MIGNYFVNHPITYSCSHRLRMLPAVINAHVHNRLYRIVSNGWPNWEHADIRNCLKCTWGRHFEVDTHGQKSKLVCCSNGFILQKCKTKLKKRIIQSANLNQVLFSYCATIIYAYVVERKKKMSLKNIQSFARRPVVIMYNSSYSLFQFLANKLASGWNSEKRKQVKRLAHKISSEQISEKTGSR